MPRVKITQDQRDNLLRLARRGGFAGSREYARAIGVSEGYGLVLLARETNPHRKLPTRNNNSPKWARAIANGPVIA